jgi:hypothetical protein
MENRKDNYYTDKEIEFRERFSYWPLIGLTALFWIVISLVLMSGNEAIHYITFILFGV